MKSKKLFISFCLILALVAIPFIGLGANPAAPAKTGVLKLGVSQPMSGPLASWGNPISEVASIYVDLLNKDGGVTIGGTTYKLKLIVSDDKSTPDGIKASADRLVHTEKVNAAFAGWVPIIVSVFGRECTAANIPCIQAVREYPGLGPVSPKYPVMFNLTNPQIQCVRLFIPKLKSTVLPNVENFALVSKDDLAGTLMFKMVKDLKQEYEEKYGLKLIYDSIFPLMAQDMTPWLSKIAALPKVDLIYAVSTTPTNLAMIAKQSYELGLKCPIVAVTALADVGVFCDTAGYDAAQFVYCQGCAPWDFAKTSAKYRDMANRIRKVWKDKHGTDLTYSSSFEWCANLIAAYIGAAKIANSIKTEDIIRALETNPIEHFYGASVAGGEKTYGIKRMFIFEVTIGKIVGREQKPVVSFGEPIP
jgi:ABC-type branched-subunit amino acid transport system substrate-binding protein